MATIQKDIDKRTAILNATLDLVAERGFHNAPVSQVAKRSGVSAGIIYHYFENKDDLIHALYKHIKQQYGHALMQDSPHLLPWPDHLVKLWHNAYSYYVTNSRETAFIEQYENSPYYEGWEVSGVLEDENMQALMKMIQQDFSRGYIIEVPFDVLYELTLGVAVGLAKREISGTLQTTDQLLDLVAQACVRAVAK